MSVWHYYDGKNTVGPFDEATMQKLIVSGMIGGDTQVSQNSGDWTRLADTNLKVYLPGLQKWFYRQGESAVGPFDQETIKNLIRSGILGAASEVRRDGESEWRKIYATPLAGLISLPPSLPTPGAVKRSRLGSFITFMNRGSFKIRCAKWGGLMFVVWFAISTLSHSGTTQEKTDYQGGGVVRSSYSDMSSPPARTSNSGVCEFCNGTGHSRDYYQCVRCSGRGTITTPSGYEMACSDCGGTGRTDKCIACGGTGKSR